MTLALPLGISSPSSSAKIFCPPPLRHIFRFLVELLAAIPSVIYGLWGIAVVVPLIEANGSFLAKTVGHWLPIFAGPVYGNCMLTASLVLALMVLPTITAISRNALQSVPQPLREGGYAVGFTRWETIGKILLPTAAPAIVASAVLALGRAMGETMAMAMLIGNSSHLSPLASCAGGTLAGLLANQFAEGRRHDDPRADVRRRRAAFANPGSQSPRRRNPADFSTKGEGIEMKPPLLDFSLSSDEADSHAEIQRMLRKPTGSPRRLFLNGFFNVLCIAVSVVALVPLLSLVFLVVEKGAPLISWKLFTQLPPAPGLTGGGHWQCAAWNRPSWSAWPWSWPVRWAFCRRFIFASTVPVPGWPKRFGLPRKS